MDKPTTSRYALAAGIGALALATAVTTGVLVSGGVRPNSAAALSLQGATTVTDGAGQAAGITVTGNGTVNGTSDILHLRLGVEVTESTVDAALTRANAAAKKLHDALKKAGVKDADLQTTGLNIQPDYSYPDGGGTPTLKGYAVSESVSATLRDIDTAGATISAVVAAGGNDSRVQGISLDLEGTGPLLTDARKRAVEDAEAKAKAYASALGRDLGDLVSLTEQVSTPSPVAVNSAASDLRTAVPIEPGTQAVGVTVVAVYAFG